MSDSPTLIVGGGIAGLATALGLARHHKASRVFERAPAFEEVGAGVQLGPNAVKALQYLRAWDAMEPACFSPSEIHVRDGQSGELLQRVRLQGEFEKRFGAPYRVIHRSDLLSGLVQTALHATGISLETSAPVTALSDSGASLTVGNREIKGGTIVGADGIHSLLRRSLQGVDGKANHHHTLYRKLIDIAQVPVGVDAEVVTLWMCPGGHIVCYAVSAGQKFNIVASVEERQQHQSPTLPNLSEGAAAILATPGAWLPWSGFDVEPNSNWYGEHAVLIGDAAHATLPYLAQGAAMSLEDACVLAQNLVRRATRQEAFAEYAQARFPRTRRLQLQSRDQGRIYHMSGLTRRVRNLAIKTLPGGAFLNRLAWIYDWTPD